MATNLRLRQETTEALQREAQRTGRSQQEIIREALDQHLGLSAMGGRGKQILHAVTEGLRAPRSPYRKASKRLRLPTRRGSQDLLERDERL